MSEVKKSKTFLHSGARGDIIYSLPTVKCLGGGILYIEATGKYCIGKSIDVSDVGHFKRLLTKADYIDDVLLWCGEPVQYNLNDFRTKGGNLFYGPLIQNHLNAFNVTFDLSKPWLEKNNYGRKYLSDIIINHSTRYPGRIKNWDVLKDYYDKITFIGFESEYYEFCKNNSLELKFYKVKSYLEIAEIILASKLYIGNQSFIYSIAEAFKIPRILSVYDVAPNCGPTYNAYDFINKNLIEKFINF
jgi:hypothetical protein